MSSRASTPAGKTSTPAGKSPPSTQTQQPQPSTGPMVPHEKIAMCAYDKWCRRGCVGGCEQQDWLEAESELKTEIAKSSKTPR